MIVSLWMAYIAARKRQTDTDGVPGEEQFSWLFRMLDTWSGLWPGQRALPPAEPRADQQAKPPADQQAEPQADQQAEPQADEQAEPPADQQAEPPADQQAEPGADEQAEPPADQQAEPPADQQAEPPADQQAEPPADQQAEPPADQQAMPKAESTPAPPDLPRPISPSPQEGANLEVQVSQQVVLKDGFHVLSIRMRWMVLQDMPDLKIDTTVDAATRNMMITTTDTDNLSECPTNN
ncbi:glutenin, low molecular weight subunit-like isoform X4 [Coturnix japonica]|uniref:glutenin, low molecular weight subunit-like isoform X4 n=1 Tax=Coturnix japonica TaxID=93934 RepID=UPI0013A5D293|nr:glutenin, low molecular weight subunit-like isoform X4 [Coturnix japonica]